MNCVEVSVLDDVEGNLQNQKHSVVKETICIRLASIEKISHAKEDPRRSSCQFLSNIVEASKGRRSLGIAPQQPSKLRANMNKADCIGICYTYNINSIRVMCIVTAGAALLHI